MQEKENSKKQLIKFIIQFLIGITGYALLVHFYGFKLAIPIYCIHFYINLENGYKTEKVKNSIIELLEELKKYM